MKKLVLILAFVGFLGAAVFYWGDVLQYWPWHVVSVSQLFPYGCPVCVYIYSSGPRLTRFVVFTLVMGTLNAALFVAIGSLILLVVKRGGSYVKKVVLVFALVGFLGAALFYFSGMNNVFRYGCPLCPYIFDDPGWHLLRLVHHTLVEGALNAALFAAAGSLILGATMLFRQLGSKLIHH